MKTPHIKLFSFGYKYYSDELPEYDLRIDLRGKIENPQSHLPKGAIGKDKIVIKTILKEPKNKKFIENLFNKIKTKVLESKSEDFTIGIGCKSGIHRSVVVTDEMASKLKKLGYLVEIVHLHLKEDSNNET